jgi:prophage regulatory protein
MHQATQIDRALRIEDVMNATGYARSTIYLRVKSGEFPPPQSWSHRTSRWCESEVAQTLNLLRAGAPKAQIRAAVRDMVEARKSCAA